MCGFAGYLSRSVQENMAETVSNMAETISYRGPDDSGTWVDETVGVALSHRRLSIVDLSHAGHQPMHSVSGRYVLAFNGEIYNHLLLRAELQAAGAAPDWRGHSDTETLLSAFECWGLAATLHRCVGMFAIALWDRQTRTLTLARDRFGEKPLYYGWVGRGAQRAFVFGSELKALRAYQGFDAAVSREALAEYMRFSYVPAPLSIYQGVYKLEPGCLLSLAAGTEHTTMTRWWSLSDAVINGLKNPLTNEQVACGELERVLGDAVKQQSLADVPLGAFLSGGVDSSTIVAFMQQQASRPVKTFTIGFDEADFDESPHALAVARHLGTDHHEMRVTPPIALDVISSLPEMYDEPFADSSQIPTHLVCKAARQNVTVALSGDAGDELFGGYNRYFWGPRIWDRFSWLPFPLRRALADSINAVPPMLWATLGRVAGVALMGSKVHKLARRLGHVKTLEDLYWSLVTEWVDPAAVVRGVGGTKPVALYDSPLRQRVDVVLPQGLDSVAQMMYRDTLTYLPDDILCKLDRAAMATSLETRVPFLDHRVAELAWRLPMRMKIRGNTGKWLLRQVLYKYVPRELIERPKAGFAIPVGQWLRGPLRAWAEALLEVRRLEVEGYFDPAPIRQRWQEHLSGRADHTASLWAVLMFQAWHEANH